MSPDEQAVRNLIENWARATADGDLSAILAMMTGDAVFLTPGAPPMRRADFEWGFNTAIEKFRITAQSDIQELRVAGDWAYCWNHLDVTMTPLAGGVPVVRSGHTLTVFHKENGAWLLARDANLVA